MIDNHAFYLAGTLTEETYSSDTKVKNTMATDTDGALSKVETPPSGGVYAVCADNFSYTAAGAVSSIKF